MVIQPSQILRNIEKAMILLSTLHHIVSGVILLHNLAQSAPILTIQSSTSRHGYTNKLNVLQLHRIHKTNVILPPRIMAVKRPTQHAMEVGGEGGGLKHRCITERALFAVC